ncbi:hypothetical protein Tco_0747687 [Tanacetum coccineum]|uniref:Uncharacterized protein n=1 Tax=Tanacetum coccineum TaxID=301880 RepID=A0ABQ4YUK9_9ASTR
MLTECKIVGQILLDHPLSYALTATANVPAVYLQQFWKTVRKVPNTEDTIIFTMDTQNITYTMDMFRGTLKLLVETPNNLFVASVNIEVIQSFMQTVGYQGVVDKVSAFFMKFLSQPWQTMFKVFNSCLTTRTRHDQTKINILQLFHVVVNRTNVDYAALLWLDFMNYVSQKKDVIQYPRFTKLIIAELMKKFLSIPPRLKEDYHSIKDDIILICATDDYRGYKTLFVNVVVPMNQPQLVVSTQGMHRSTPRVNRTPTLITTSPQGKKRKQREKDVESYADKFVASIIHDDVDDFEDRIKPGSHKEHPEVVDDDDDNKEEKKDEKKGDEIDSLENRTEKMQTLIPTTPRSSRINLASDKNIAQELMDIVSLSTPTTSKDSHKKICISSKYNHLPRALQDDATPEGEKRVKRYKTSKSSKSARASSSKQSAKDSTTYVSKQQHQQQEWVAWEEETVINEDEVILEDETPELITKFQNVDKRVPTIFDHARMEATLNDMLSNQFRNTEEYAYHLEQATNLMEHQIV